MNTRLIPFLLTSTLLLSGCDDLVQPPSNGALTVNKADAVASVNGKFISKEALKLLEEDIAERSQGQQNFPKDKLIEELVQRELLIQSALQKQLDKTPDVQQKIELARQAILSQAAIQDYLKSNPITDEEVKAEYEKNVGGENNLEYKARHILVKAEDEAKKLIAELDKGANFEELANKNSTGPSAPQGGDLGWFAANQMVAPFSEAVIALENGKYSTAPVETQFGWHVILREDSRAQKVPALDAVKEQITPFLERQKIQDMMTTMRTQAQVEILVPLTDEEPQTADSQEQKATDEAATQEENSDKTDEAAPESSSTEQSILESAEQAPEEATEKVEETAAEATEKVKESAAEATQATEQAVTKAVESVKDSVKSLEVPAEQ